MEIRDYFEILLRRKWIILVTMIATIATAAVISSMMTPVYTATATVRVATGTPGRLDYADYVYSERLMNTYAEIITTQPVLEEVKARLQISTLPSILVETIPDTELLQITTEGYSPERVRDVANALADVLQSQTQDIYSGSGQTAQEALAGLLGQVESDLSQARAERRALTPDSPEAIGTIEALSRTIELNEQSLTLLLTQYEDARLSEAVRAATISIIESASTPAYPSQPRTKVNLMLGAVVGLAAGAGLALLIENLDTTYYKTAEVESEVQLPILGKLPEDKSVKKTKARWAFSTNGFSAQREAYRRLRTNILTLQAERNLKTLMVASADRSEGKSTIVANLAGTFAEAGRRVIVIDGDMRLPSQHKIFELNNETGLSNVLAEGVALKDLELEEVDPGLYVLTSGPVPENPGLLLQSERMEDLIALCAKEFDVVLLDVPCLLSVTDAVILGPLVDGVVLVVSRGTTRREHLQTAERHLADVRADIVGVVINRAEKSTKYYYDSKASNRKRARKKDAT